MTPLYCPQGHENPSGNRFCKQCGEKLPTGGISLGVLPGMMLGGRYRVVRELGHGGFGRAHLAEDLHRFNESCVLKEFAPQVQGTYGLQKAEELFSREAGVLYKLQHPQIPRFRELFRVKQQHIGRLFLVQDYVEGQTYRALLDERKHHGLRFNEAEVTQLLLQILPVLEYIHSLGVVHRDISPDNLILRSTDGLPVLIDFGGVKQLAATVASQFMASSPAGGAPAIATRLGKVGYAPEEQMQGGVVYPHSDFYALGATVLVLLTGKEPSQLIDSQTLEWNWHREVNLSPTLRSVLDKMLQPRLSDRFSHAREVIQALTFQPAPVVYPPTQPPLPQTQATVAVAPPALPVPINPPSPPDNQTPLPSSTSKQSFGLLGKILLVFGLIAAAGGVGWWAGNAWIQAQKPPGTVQPQPTGDNSAVLPTNDSEPTPPPELSAEERQRKEALRQRRTKLGIEYNYYVALVNEAFWTQYPERRGRQLGTEPEDADAREQWDTVASNLLEQLEELNLSSESRRQLGSFRQADRDRWKAEANQLHLSSRTLNDLTDAKFFEQFPEEQDPEFLNKPIGQVWQAMAADTLKAFKSRQAFEQIEFEPEASSKQLSGRLKPGEGKAFIANLQEGQVMEVKLKAERKVLLSIYSPTGQTKLLEDSRDRTWSGQLPETGFYEFSIVSNASEPIDYEFDITVEGSTSPESPTDGSTE